jgi:phosphatidylinositol alpha-1,6-mannosyltransferase
MSIRMAEAEPIRVLLTLHQGGGSGAVNSTLHLALGLARRGLTVRLVCPPGSPVEAEARTGGLEVIPLALTPRRRWSNASRLATVLERYPVDLINAQSSRDREALTLLGLTGRLPVPLIITRRSWPRTTRLENWLSGQAASRVIAISEPVRRALVSTGMPAGKITVVPTGVLVDRLDRTVTPEELNYWRQRIEWDAGHRTIGIVARPKDQPVVLQALARIEAPVRLVLAGLDPAALAQPLPDIPSRHVVVRLPFESGVRPLYELLEIALHPSRWDALPQAVLEAMALGKPVIASRATGNAVLIRDEVDGLLASPEDPSDWARQLNRLLADPALAGRLGGSARRRAREEFSLERAIIGTVEVYRSVLQEFRLPRSAFRVATLANAELGTRNSELLLAYDFPPRPGGISRALGEIARHAPGMLVSTGRSPTGDRWESEAGVRVDRAEIDPEQLRTLGGLVGWARAASRAAERAHPTFVWAGNIKPAGHVARWLRARRGLPYGLIAHGLDLGILAQQADRSARKRLIARQLFAAAGGVVSNSRWTADRCARLLEQLDLPHLTDRIRVVHLGADPTRFSPHGPAGTLGPGRWLLTVARLVPHKGIDTAIGALALLAGSRPDLRYAVAGEGPDRQRLVDLAARHGVTDRIRFLGAVADVELPGVYRAATVYLGLSREEGIEVEGFGLALAEAQATARPVVAARSGGIPETIAEGESGVLVPPDDSRAVALAIGALLDDPARCQSLGRAGRERVERYLNWNRAVEQLSLAARAFQEQPRR